MISNWDISQLLSSKEAAASRELSGFVSRKGESKFCLTSKWSDLRSWKKPKMMQKSPWPCTRIQNSTLTKTICIFRWEGKEKINRNKRKCSLPKHFLISSLFSSNQRLSRLKNATSYCAKPAYCWRAQSYRGLRQPGRTRSIMVPYHSWWAKQQWTETQIPGTGWPPLDPNTCTLEYNIAGMQASAIATSMSSTVGELQHTSKLKAPPQKSSSAAHRSNKRGWHTCPSAWTVWLSPTTMCWLHTDKSVSLLKNVISPLFIY